MMSASATKIIAATTLTAAFALGAAAIGGKNEPLPTATSIAQDQETYDLKVELYTREMAALDKNFCSFSNL